MNWLKRISLSNTEYMEIGRIEITPSAIKEYSEAVGLNSDSYVTRVPNIFLVSKSISMMLEKFDIADGAIHSNQDITNLGTAFIGDIITCYGYRERSRSLKDMQIFGVACKFQNQDHVTVCESRSVVMVRIDE